MFQIEFCTVVQKHLATILCHNKTVLDGLTLLVSVSKFGIDTARNRWYRIDLKKLVSPIPTFWSGYLCPNSFPNFAQIRLVEKIGESGVLVMVLILEEVHTVVD